MTSPSLSFKPGNALLSISPRACLDTTWGETVTETYVSSDLNTVLVGVNASPYFYDEKLIPISNRSVCTNNLWGNINAVFARNISNPSSVIRMSIVSGIPVEDNVRVNKLSGGFCDVNDFTSNIFDPGFNGRRVYGMAGIYVDSYNATGNPLNCLFNICQSSEIRYTMRNIYNPRDTIIQTVGYKQPLRPLQLVNLIRSSNKADFLTEVKVNCSRNDGDGGWYGFGNFIDAKAKTIEMKGLTSTNISTFVKDTVTSMIYDQRCLRWNVTSYTPNAEGKFVNNPSSFQPSQVLLREKVRPQDEILYSDYFEGSSTTKTVRYFEVVMPSTGFVVAEIYATIDISGTSPIITTWSSWRAGVPPGSDDYKYIRTGFDSSNNQAYFSRELTQPFIPDMPLVWGRIPNLQIIESFTGMNISGIDVSSFGGNYFMMLGDFNNPSNPNNNIGRSVLIFTPNCGSGISCNVSSDCNVYNVCDSGRCVQCSSSDTSKCVSNQICVQNSCIDKKTCSSELDCAAYPLKGCNTQLNLCVECTGSSQCPETKVCNVLTNTCINKSIECSTNSECGTNKDCVEGVCKDIQTKNSIVIPIIIGVSVLVVLIVLYIFRNLKKKR